MTVVGAAAFFFPLLFPMVHKWCRPKDRPTQDPGYILQPSHWPECAKALSRPFAHGWRSIPDIMRCVLHSTAFYPTETLRFCVENPSIPLPKLPRNARGRTTFNDTVIFQTLRMFSGVFSARCPPFRCLLCTVKCSMASVSPITERTARRLPVVPPHCSSEGCPHAFAVTLCCG